MKRKIIKSVLTGVFALFVGYTVCNTQNGNNELSSLVLDNVEALASESSMAGCMRCNVDVRFDCFVYTNGWITSYCPYMRGF